MGICEGIYGCAVTCRTGEGAPQGGGLLQAGEGRPAGGGLARRARVAGGRLQEQAPHCAQAAARQQARTLPFVKHCLQRHAALLALCP